MSDTSTCVNCSTDYLTDDMFWVDEEPGMPVGYYCYECDANLITGIAGESEED